LEEQSAGRVQELVPIRYRRMAASPFAFIRGGALVMAADLSTTPTAGVTVQLCGDAHVSNFGLFGSPERRMLFDINDFDETLPGPWEWDVKRLAASLEILGRDRGFTADARRDIVLQSAGEYRERLRQTASLSTLDAWYDHLAADDLLRLYQREVQQSRLAKREGHQAQRMVTDAFSRDSVRVFSRRVTTSDGGARIVADPPLIVPVEDLAEPGTEWEDPAPLIKRLLASYRKTLGRHGHPLEEFRYAHGARKVVGVGSVGTRCYILLLLGRDDNDPLFLQVKEAGPSVLERYLPPSTYSHHGERVVAGQRLMQAATDIFLGWQRIRGLDGLRRDYYIRQFQDWKGGLEVENVTPGGAAMYGRICGATLARAHARWGDRIAIASYLGRSDSFERSIARFALRYADQNERDFEKFLAAAKTGRITAALVS
jgi:uncharacterized protein (DUF2252 family)